MNQKPPQRATGSAETGADGTRMAGAAYQSLRHFEGTRMAEVGYQSMLATPLKETTEERYQIGQKIGNRYEVLAIHKGSMGVVYGTFDHKTNLPRALKTVQRRFAGNKRMSDLFTAEALTWVKLEKHPFIIHAYLVNEYDSQPYVITEYIRGQKGMGSDLRAWLGHPKLTIKIAVEMALQIAQGMQHAQRKVPGLVHRDLKPANVMVDGTGRAKVTDFGLVHAAEAGAGTPAYMAPEQWRGEEVDTRSDIYSYGCILYEMFTGHRMFNATGIDEWKQAHLGYLPVAPRLFKSELPQGLEDLILSCLAKEARHRPQNWDEVVETCAFWFHHLTGQPAVLDFRAYELDLKELIAASYSLGTLEKYEEMLDACERALAIDPNYTDARLNKGNALRELKRYEEALAAYDRTLTIDPNNIYAWNNKGAALADLKRYEEAVAAYDRALAIDLNNVAAWTNKCIALENLKRYEEAFAAYDRILAIDPNFASAWYNKGNALSELKRYGEAIAAYDRALAIDPNKTNAWYNKGSTLANLKRYGEAIAAYDRALTIDPNDGYAWYNKGNALYYLKRHEEAVAAYDRALAINPNDAKAWNGKGNTLAGLKRYEEALAAYDSALAIDPNDAAAWNNKGSALVGLKRYEEAVAAYDRALAIDPNDANVWNNKGIAKNALKNKRKPWLRLFGK